MNIIPTTDALNEVTVMRQVRKLAKYTEENFDEIKDKGGSTVHIILADGYYILEVIN